ncbi:MAG: restriction endonuclease subunit S [Actinobacteria bacterium]|nr:restriction endonuclease subunit S [Actinomycetota bacterium]
MPESGTLPIGWRWVKLGEVCKINPSKPKKFTRSPNTPTTFLPMASIDDVKGNIAKPEVVPYSKVAKGYTYFEENDVLFAKITPCMQNGKHAIAKNLIDGIGFGTTEFHVIKASAEILPKWIHYFIRQTSFLEEATAYFTGVVGQQRVPKSFLENYLIPLPSISDQRRIIWRVDNLMKQVEYAYFACKKQHEATRALSAAYLRAVFESEDAKKWDIRKLGEVCQIFSGSSAPQDKKYFENGEYPFVRVQDLSRYGRKTDLTEFNDYINETAIKKQNMVRAEKGTIIFPKSGAAIITNNRAILGTDAYIVSHLAAVKPKENIADTLFIYYWLCNVDMVQYMENTGYPSLKLSIISTIPIQLPSFNEQRRIAASLEKKISCIDKLQKAIEKQLKVVDALYLSVLRVAFRGEM